MMLEVYASGDRKKRFSYEESTKATSLANGLSKTHGEVLIWDTRRNKAIAHWQHGSRMK